MAEKIDGFAELDRALGQLPRATARNALNRGLKRAATPTLETWKALAPRDQGFLVQSIIMGPSSKLNRSQRQDARREGQYFAEIHVGTNDPAGRQQEFGNINHVAQPSGRPAWDSNKAKALATLKDFLWEEIQKSARRYAKKLAKGG